MFQVKYSILLSTCLGIFLSAPVCFSGDIVGTVEIQSGILVSPKPISPFARARTENSREQYKSSSNVVVYLESNPSLDTAVPSTKPVMDQINYTIDPHVLPVSVGTTVRFPNSDQVYHNLFSLSSAKKFDLGRYPKGVYKEVTFDKPGEVRIYCDIHPSMSGVIIVVPNGYFATVSEDGEFTIKDVPTGSFTITAWHEQLSRISQSVQVPEKGTVKVDLIYKER